MKIGFIGLGVMGEPMAGHILEAGYNLVVWNRSPDKAQDLVSMGAKLASSVSELVQSVDVVITIIGDPASVREMYFGDDGIIANTREGMTLIDMTTTEPGLAREIYEQSEAKGATALDAPVSGGDVGAQNGTLSIMVGGKESSFDTMLPIFECMGKSVNYMGAAGSGQSVKMANQISIAGSAIGMCEALMFAKRSGLDVQKVIDVISGGAGGSWYWTNLAIRVMGDDLESCFFIKHFVKDLKIAIDECNQMDIQLPGLLLVYDLYDRMLENGYETYGTQALILALEEMNT